MVLRIGQRVPDFVLPDTEGEQRRLAEFTKQGNVIMAFFPFAFSGASDKEMCMFRDEFGSSQGQRIGILGISVDSVFSLKAFAQTYNLPFPLLSDFNKKVSRLYGVLQDSWGGLSYKGVAKHSIFLLDQRAMLRYKWASDVPSEEPPYPDVMRAIQKVTS